MPEVNTSNTITPDEWEKRKTFIIAYREGLISRTEFCIIWSSFQILNIYQNSLKDGAKC